MIEIYVDAEQTRLGIARIAERMPKVLKEAQKEVEREALRRFRRTASTWKHQPKFEALTEIRGNTVEMIAGTDDLIYHFIDVGTRPHAIRARNAKVLAFQGGYTAKTTPRRIASHAGGPFGDMVFRKEVWHPGTQPRQFGEVIQAEMGPLSYQIIEKHIDAELRGFVR